MAKQRLVEKKICECKEFRLIKGIESSQILKIEFH